MNGFYIGVDVGTGSARAGVFDDRGQCLGVGKKDILIFKDAGHIVEQSSDNIWRSVCHAVQIAMSQAGIAADQVRGLGFDATCSLVVVNPDGNPLSVGPTDTPDRNIIVWMDHRATDQTRRINQTGHGVLRYVGGQMSPEMETPKLLCLARRKNTAIHSGRNFGFRGVCSRFESDLLNLWRQGPNDAVCDVSMAHFVRC